MRLIPIIKKHEPARLHEELLAAGVPVVSVWSSQLVYEEPHRYGYVQCEDSANVGTVQAVVATHADNRPTTKNPTVAERTSALAGMVKHAQKALGKGKVQVTP